MPNSHLTLLKKLHKCFYRLADHIFLSQDPSATIDNTIDHCTTCASILAIRTRAQPVTKKTVNLSCSQYSCATAHSISGCGRGTQST